MPYIRKQNYFHSICYQYNNINELEKIKVKTIGLDIIDFYLNGECWLYPNWNNESKNIYLSKKIINDQEITILTLDFCHDFQYYIIFNNYLYYISNQTKLTKEQLCTLAVNSNFKYDIKNKQLLATDKNRATFKIILNVYQQYIKFIKMNNYSQKFLPIIEQEIDEYINSYKKLIK